MARILLADAPLTMPALSVAAALRSGCPVADDVFDRVFPPALRDVSFQHWTPVAVARRAAQLLVGAGARRVLDVGSGPGKFCIVGALTTLASFTGIERRPSLVEVARRVAEESGTDRAAFFRGNALRFPFDHFDGFYLYNPFYEQVNLALLQIDETNVHSPVLFRRCVLATRAKLRRMPRGTAVVTYHGFGGTMADGYRQVHRENAGDGTLALWIKVRPRWLPT
jgi:SAM-dependent methyltransferase